MEPIIFNYLSHNCIVKSSVAWGDQSLGKLILYTSITHSISNYHFLEEMMSVFKLDYVTITTLTEKWFKNKFRYRLSKGWDGHSKYVRIMKDIEIRITEIDIQ